MKVEDRILKVMYLHYEENPKVTVTIINNATNRRP